VLDDVGRPAEADISPVLHQDPYDLRLSIASIIHWADNRDLRLQAMGKIAFPVSDVFMFLVVNQLAYRGALRPTDLASTLGTGRANISKIVRRLETIGLVSRVPSPSDERSVLVALTATGRVYGEQIMRIAEDNLQEVIGGWDDQEVETLRRLVARFACHAIAEVTLRSPALRPPAEGRAAHQ
jgi:DNA-binding MarR family transcriptional regulator